MVFFRLISTPSTITLTSVIDGGAGKNPVVSWSCTQGGVAGNQGLGPQHDAALGALISSGDGTSVIWSKITYAYHSPLSYFLTGTQNWTNNFYLKPRRHRSADSDFQARPSELQFLSQVVRWRRSGPWPNRVLPAPPNATVSTPARLKIRPAIETPRAAGRGTVLGIEQPIVERRVAMEPHGMIDAAPSERPRRNPCTCGRSEACPARSCRRDRPAGSGAGGYRPAGDRRRETRYDRRAAAAASRQGHQE